METLRARIPDEFSGWRLDRALAQIFPEYSRSLLQRWIRQECVTLAQRAATARSPVRGGEEVELVVLQQVQADWQAEDIPLKVIHEDDALLVIDKPAGLVIHPGAGNPGHTLFNALLHLHPAASLLPRAGLVHRLDKDTSGLLAVAKTLEAHTHLVAQFSAHGVKRRYRAVVEGVVAANGRIHLPIGRNPRNRKKMAVVPGGREAVTHYRVLKRFRRHSDLELRLETGRTHQVRVHLAHIGHPVTGDPRYGGQRGWRGAHGEALRACLKRQSRQALHAQRLELLHPVSGRRMRWESPLPDDLQELLTLLAADARRAAE